ncbi:hypothetical protein GGH94_003641 [Coemansia aciculifera]|uniref:DNA repair protein rad9 n=1 Tax=Coemansia aciculifera TaxID=417176 RepID=A0A9W8INF9_9FUNG|nr:hypothetical protein GGH94_003641 [Coemansia aciculifera]KAJ2873180.1 hypothetical protein GGH93_003436 [Coemansia aciculifera]
MEAEVPAASLKTFYRALQCLGSIGEDIWIEARTDHLELIGKNASQSAYARIVFPAEFFDAYDSGESDNAVFRCRVQAKQLVGIFRSRTQAVEQCVLSIEQAAEPVHINSSATQGECRLVVRLAYKQRVCRTHRLFYEACETFHSTYDRRDCKGRWRVAAAHAASWVAHFARGSEEMTLQMTSSVVRVRSWTAGNVAQPDATRALHTELSVDPADFDMYHVPHPVELALALREFRAVLRYAERMAAPLSAFFDRPGWPLLLEVAAPPNPDARDHRQAPPTAEFVLATVADETTPAPSSNNATPASRAPTQILAVPDSIEPGSAPSPDASPYAHSRSSFAQWSPDNRSDSLLATPASARRANTATADSIAGSLPNSLGGPASQPVPESRVPTARAYRLLDMPRPYAPPGLTDTQLSDEHAAADELRNAPPGMVQTTLPFPTTAAQRPQGDMPVANADYSSDEELDATPPPPSKRMRALF